MDMKRYATMLNAARTVSGIVLILGLAIFCYGFFVSDYSAITGIGIGTVMGAGFIFIISVVLVASEEMVEKTSRRRNRL
ncbi:hypothetical protein [Bacillus massiliglaciei]|uniref:hypothetical protein n=1 Tax=Bacillus massiliglaciei TaxID=1816693 RepID=UPI000AA56B30|nr:hypothetical protein [Bacillus massiliglaciei]